MGPTTWKGLNGLKGCCPAHMGQAHGLSPAGQPISQGNLRAKKLGKLGGGEFSSPSPCAPALGGRGGAKAAPVPHPLYKEGQGQGAAP